MECLINVLGEFIAIRRDTVTGKREANRCVALEHCPLQLCSMRSNNAAQQSLASLPERRWCRFETLLAQEFCQQLNVLTLFSKFNFENRPLPKNDHV